MLRIWPLLRAAACLHQTSPRSFPGNRAESSERSFLYIISLVKKLGDKSEKKKLLDLKIISGCPWAFSYQSWAGFVLPMVCVGVTDRWWQSGHFLPSCQTKEGPGGVWHEPCLCQRCPQLLGTQMHNLHSCSLGIDGISGERGQGAKEGRKVQGPRVARSIVVAEQFAQKKTLWH